MHRYWDSVVKPILEITKPKSIIEIGVNEGKNTLQLIDYCEKNDSQLFSIDPYKAEILNSYDNHPNFHFIKDISLNALYTLSNFDVVLLDGDHNWYTVYHELKLIEKNCENFPLVLAHDIGWPYGRRDLYYNPELIPSEYLKPYKNDGLIFGKSELSNVGGLNRHLNNCVYENNYKNGVLTAIEDFLSSSQHQLKLYTYPAFHGLGVIFSKEYDFLLEDLKNFEKKVLQELENARILNLHKITDLKNQNSQLITKNNKLSVANDELIAQNKQLVITNNQLVSNEAMLRDKLEEKDNESIHHLEEIENKLRRDNEILSNEKKEIELKLTELEKGLILSQKKVIELKNNVSIKQQEIEIHLNSIKYQVGELIVNCYYNPIKLFSLPYRMWKVFRDGKAKNNKISVRKSSDNLIQPRKIISDVSIVICVHNALDDLKACLESLYSKQTYPFNLIIVDDGSDFETKEFLRKKKSKYNYLLISNETALGYTISANKGIKAAADSRYVILLNSDTIVTYRWIEKLVACMESDELNGIVGPLSNAASWQSVPKLKEGDEWSLNPLNGLTVEQMAKIVDDSSSEQYPEVPLINGFCYMISKKVIDAIGLLDEKTFPRGYGEEDDYSFRAADAGFKLRIADNCYIYHAKSKSFTPEGRKKIVSKSKNLLFEKHTKQRVIKSVSTLSDNSYLDNLRKKIETRCSELTNQASIEQSVKKNGAKIAVYTAIFGDYDELNDPIIKVDGIDYICFTNNPKISSEKWTIIHVEEDKSLDLVRNARKVKILAHQFLPDYDYSIWMDANFHILDNPIKLIDQYLCKCHLATYKHSGGRTCIYSEADACIRLGKDDPEVIKKQMETYRSDGYPEYNGLVETGVLLRRHNNPEIISLMELWWDQIQQHSRRDQLSFNYVMWKKNYEYEVIEDYIRDNFCFLWAPHKSKSSR